MSIIITNTDQMYQTAGFGKTASAIMFGIVANRGITKFSKKINQHLVKKIDSIQSNVDSTKLELSISKMLEDINRNKDPENYIKILDFSKKTIPIQEPPTLKEVINTQLNGKSLLQKLNIIKDAYMERIGYRHFVGLVQGRNASFNRLNNTLSINVPKRGVAVFHELGHALNYNNSNILRSIQKSRLKFFLMPFILLSSALLSRPKVEGEKSKNIIDKSLIFIKSNVGKLTALSMFPMFIEEAIASIKGNKLVSKYAPQLAKQVKKSNVFAGATYLTTILATSMGSFVANKIRDYITKPKLLNTHIL